jgi:hypothetical protein
VWWSLYAFVDLQRMLALCVGSGTCVARVCMLVEREQPYTRCDQCMRAQPCAIGEPNQYAADSFTCDGLCFTKRALGGIDRCVGTALPFHLPSASVAWLQTLMQASILTCLVKHEWLSVRYAVGHVGWIGENQWYAKPVEFYHTFPLYNPLDPFAFSNTFSALL